MLTFNAPEVALANVRALAGQSWAPVGILVVENPGPRLVDPARLQAAASVPVRVERLHENVGPAGGFAEGLRVAAALDVDALWVMDDDILPAPDCLELLVDRWLESDRRAVVAPRLVHRATGEDESTWGWCGVLFDRSVVGAIGLPRAELFYGFEDQDYLVDRCQLAGFPLVREPRATAELPHRDPDITWPRWHFYYLPRNATHQYLYVRRHIAFISRVKRLTAYLLDVTGVMRAGGSGWREWLLFSRGIIDGVVGRMGRRVEPAAERRATRE